MKLHFFVYLALLTIIVGCQNEITITVDRNKCSLVASIENGGADTRTAVDRLGSISWLDSDTLGVFGTTTSNAKFSSTGSGTSVLFEGDMSYEGEDIICVYYPYDDKATLQDNKLTFSLPAEYDYTGASHAPMLGVKDDGSSYKFKHLCGLMRVSIVGVPKGKSVFTLMSQGENAPYIAGTAVVDDINEMDAVLNLSKQLSSSVTVTIETNEVTNAILYIPLPVGTYPKLAVSYKDDTQQYFAKSVSNVTINRGMLLDMPVLATVDDYCDVISSNVGSCVGEDKESTIENIVAWLEEQPFIAELSINDYVVSLKFTNGMECDVVFEDYDQYFSEAESVDPVPMSVRNSEIDDFLASNVYCVTEERPNFNDINKISNRKVLCHAPLNTLWGGLEWGGFGGRYHENEFFNHYVKKSPINLQYTFDNGGSKVIETYDDYGVICITETHGIQTNSGKGVGAFAVKGYDPVSGSEQSKTVLYVYLGSRFDMFAWSFQPYTYIMPAYIKQHVKDDAIVAAMYCWGSGINFTNCNWIAPIDMATRPSNTTNIQCYFKGLFNGLTHEASVEKCGDDNLGHYDKSSDKRYFSIHSRLLRVDGLCADVAANINGWDNLKGIIITNKWPHTYKTDQLRYMVYYKDEPFTSPDEEGVRAEAIKWYTCDWNADPVIIWGHYQYVTSGKDNLLMQCRIQASNVVGKTCYFALGFEYIDFEGVKNIYHGPVLSYVTQAKSNASSISRSNVDCEESFICFDAESLRTLREDTVGK